MVFFVTVIGLLLLLPPPAPFFSSKGLLLALVEVVVVVVPVPAPPPQPRRRPRSEDELDDGTRILTGQINSEFRAYSKYGVKMALAQRRAPILANIRPVKMCSQERRVSQTVSTFHLI